MSPLDVFRPETREWFERTFDAPTPAQALGWPAIASGEHTLIQAPTGSGKTLAAFLYGIDRLTAEGAGKGLRLLYVSPLKALNYDIERNLRGPLAGLESDLRVAVRTGDTPQRERSQMLREHPDVLITTPESLFLLLTSRARAMLRSVRTIVVDEVHAVASAPAAARSASATRASRSASTCRSSCRSRTCANPAGVLSSRGCRRRAARGVGRRSGRRSTPRSSGSSASTARRSSSSTTAALPSGWRCA